MLCICKKSYEHTRKKARHFTIHLSYYYGYSVYVRYVMIIVIISITVLTILLTWQVKHDRKEYFKHNRR